MVSVCYQLAAHPAKRLPDRENPVGGRGGGPAPQRHPAGLSDRCGRLSAVERPPCRSGGGGNALPGAKSPPLPDGLDLSAGPVRGRTAGPLPEGSAAPLGGVRPVGRGDPADAPHRLAVLPLPPLRRAAAGAGRGRGGTVSSLWNTVIVA